MASGNNLSRSPAGLLEDFRRTHAARSRLCHGAVWNYIASGSGDLTLVLLAGGARYGESWFPYFGCFEQRMRVIAPTYPAVHTMEAIVEGLIDLLDSEATGELILWGQSFGGMAAQVMTRRCPDRVKAMILSNTGAPTADMTSDVKTKWTSRMRKAGNILSMLPKPVFNRIAVAAVAEKHFKTPGPDTAFWIGYLSEIIREHTTKKEYAAINGACIPDFYENYVLSAKDLEAWKGRTLLMYSDGDPVFTPPEREALVALYPGAARYCFATGGHMALILNAEEAIRAVTDFLKV